MNRLKRWTAAILMLSLLLSWPSVMAVDAAGPYDTGIRINPIEGIESRPGFIRGADISMLKQIEDNGGKYYDSGVEKDLLQILKDHGVNWVRLRTWHNPVDQNGVPLGGGNNDKATTVALAKRAKTLGLKLLLDFHYSDFWADPGKQTKPAAWANLSGAALEQAVYDYTDDVIKALKAENAMPDMVQIGNETNGGMIWPDGKTWQQTPGETIGGYDGWTGLLKKGIQAVRDNDPNADNPAAKTKIMIHLANGGSNNLYRSVFGELTKPERGVDFDVIGLSYYPYWHGSLSELQDNMNDISAFFNKEVAVVETAYARTFDNGDSHGNIFGPNEENAGGYKATLQGQAQAFRDVMDAVAKVPNEKGLGVFYWEPAWIPVEGAGWKTGEGNAWDNQALFDFEGNALPTLDVYDFDSAIYSDITEPAVITAVRQVTLKVSVGETPVLPDTVKAEYSDDTIRNLSVAWEPIDPENWSHPGTVTVNGSIAGTAIKAVATVTVQGATNYVKNGGFETGTFTNWTVSGDSYAVDIEKSSAPGGNAYNGDYSLHYWHDGAFQFNVSQTIMNLPDGKYTLSARAHGGGGENSLVLYAVCGNGPRQEVNIVNTAWHEWKHPVIQNITVTGGSCTIGIAADANNGNWGNIDQIEFYSDNSAVTVEAPASVKPGNLFSVDLGVSGLSDLIYAQDVSVEFDADAFKFEKAEAADAATTLVEAEEAADNRIRLKTAHPAGLNKNVETIRLTFRAKGVTHNAPRTISVDSAQWGLAPSGNVMTPVSLGQATITVTAPGQSSSNRR